MGLSGVTRDPSTDPVLRPPRTVDMPPASLTLGTGLLSGRIAPARARRIVDAALDAGVRRFDTARAYGDGETEHLLGAALRRRPDTTVVTKAGLGPLRRRPAAALRWRLAAPVVGLLPERAGGRAAVGDEERDGDSGVFDERVIRASVDRSRRALRRDRIDLLLLHEFDDGPEADDAAALMLSLLDEGAIGDWGCGTRRPALRRLLDAGRRVGSIVQTTGGPLLPPAPDSGVPLSAHSVLGPRGALLNAFLEWLGGEPEHRAAWEAAVGPLDARRTAGTAVLRAAVADPANSAVLVSSSDPDSLVRTVDAVRDGEHDDRTSLLGPVFAAFRNRS